MAKIPPALTKTGALMSKPARRLVQNSSQLNRHQSAPQPGVFPVWAASPNTSLRYLPPPAAPASSILSARSTLFVADT
jgi:hypothetical protein